MRCKFKSLGMPFVGVLFVFVCPASESNSSSSSSFIAAYKTAVDRRRERKKIFKLAQPAVVEGKKKTINDEAANDKKIRRISSVGTRWTIGSSHLVPGKYCYWSLFLFYTIKRNRVRVPLRQFCSSYFAAGRENNNNVFDSIHHHRHAVCERRKSCDTESILFLSFIITKSYLFPSINNRMLGTASTALEDIFPSTASTILVTDSVEQEGRFILQSWLSNRKSVLWLSGGPPPLGSNKTNKTVRCIPAEIAESLVHHPFDAETFTKQLFGQIREWAQQQKDDEEQWIVLDDVSILSTLLGSRLLYALILSLQAEQKCKLMIRCSQQMTESDDNFVESVNAPWIGAGGSVEHNSQKQRLEWEPALVELADWIVDVLPLQSGYTREAQGRIVMSENTGKRSITGYNFIVRDGKPVVTLV